VVCKLLERLVVSQITEHLQRNRLISKEQHGFTKGKSTVTNLLEATNAWTEALLHGDPVDVIYVDYAKAFDTVPHTRLLNKVESLGIRGNALEWLRDFLTARKQKVCIGTAESKWSPVLSGVPQGSVLGPILFAIFVSGVPDLMKSRTSMFADDTKLSDTQQPVKQPPTNTGAEEAGMHDDSGETKHDRTTAHSASGPNKLQADLQKLYSWSEEMQMKLHPRKCKVLHLGHRNPRLEYKIGGEGADGGHILEETEVEKDLGVHVDNRLKFTEHVDTAVNKANRVLAALRHSFKHMDQNTFLLLYKAMVRPHLEYASCIWSPHLKKDRDKLETVQRRATRLVPNLKDHSYQERLAALRLPTLEFRRLRADMVQVYKIMHGLDHLDQDTGCPHCPGKQMLQPSLGHQTRGHTLKLQKQEATGPRAYSFPGRVVTPWNSLSASTVLANTVNAFKAGLRREWANHAKLYEYNF